MGETIKYGDAERAVLEIERMLKDNVEIVVFPEPGVLGSLHKFIASQTQLRHSPDDAKVFDDLERRLGGLDYQDGIEFIVTNGEVDLVNKEWMQSIVLGRAWPAERLAFEKFNYAVVDCGGRTSEVFQEYLEQFTPGAM